MVPKTHYAKSGDVHIAYQVIGNGPVDLVLVQGWISHLENQWEDPALTRFLNRLASFSRLIVFDKRGTGLSDRVAESALPTLEQRMDDIRAVMDAVGSKSCRFVRPVRGRPAFDVVRSNLSRANRRADHVWHLRQVCSDDYPWGPTREQH